MNITSEIRNSKRKPKELVEYLAGKAAKDKKVLKQLVLVLETGSKTERGTCAEAIERVTLDNPAAALPHLNAIIKHVDYDAPRVKWETSRVIANIARKFPGKAAKAVPKLLSNTKDASTVVKWSAAFALTEIIKHDAKQRKKLVPLLTRIAREEANNGVKKVYLKAFKKIQGNEG